MNSKKEEDRNQKAESKNTKRGPEDMVNKIYILFIPYTYKDPCIFQRRCRAKKSEDEKAKIKLAKKDNMASKRAQLTDEEREEIKRKDRERKARKREEKAKIDKEDKAKKTREEKVELMKRRNLKRSSNC